MSQEYKIDYNYLFRLLPERYIVFLPDDPHFTIVGMSDAFLEQTNKKHDGLVGSSLLKALPKSFPKAALEELPHAARQAIRTKKPSVIGYFHDDAAGLKTRYWKPVLHPIVDEKGKLETILLIFKDVTDEVLADQRLSQAQKQLDTALSIGDVGVWNWDMAKAKVVADKNFARLFAVDPARAADGLPVRAFLKSIHPMDRKRVLQHVVQVSAKGSGYDDEFRTITADGTVRWVIARGQLERDKSGRPIGFPGVVVDITSRRLAEEALRKSEAQFKFMAEAMPQKVFTASADGNRDYFNPQWTRFTGVDTAKLKGSGWIDFIHQDEREAVRRQWQRSIKTGVPFQMEYRLRRKDGTYRWHLSRAHAMHDERHKIVKWIGSSTDIAEQKQNLLNLELMAKASKILASSLDYKLVLRKIAELSVPALADWCVIDLFKDDGKWEQVALVHKDPKKMVYATKLRKLSPPEMDAPRGVPRVVRSLKAEFYPVISDELLRSSTRDENHYKLLKSAGIVSSMIVPLAVNGKGVGAITFVSAEQKRLYTKVDFEVAEELAARASQSMANAYLYASAHEEIQKRTRLEAELRKVNEQLEARVKERTRQLETSNLSLQRSNRELQDFAYVASHDLQEPLRKIRAFGNLLEDEYSEKLGDGEDYLRRMQGAAVRMSVLIEDLLSFSRVATRVRPFESVDLNVIVSEVVSDLETRLKDTNGEVQFADLPILRADPTQMRQLMQNLITNALKFHREDEDPVVKISAKIKPEGKTTPAYYEIRVKDNGIGFDEKYSDRIFAVFQRLHGRNTYEGTGIGLAVCRRIVERHGGTITVKSRPGAGSTFTVRLPVKMPQKGGGDGVTEERHSGDIDGG